MADKRVTFLISANVKQFLGGLKNARLAFRQFGQSLKNIGGTLTRSITLPLGLAGAASIKMAADFQKAMSEIRTQVGFTATQVGAFRKDIIELSNETGRSAVELAEAFKVVTSGGQRGAAAMQILEKSAKMAAVGLGESKDISRALLAVLNAYGEENISAAKAADQLFAIIRKGNMEASSLAPNLGKAIGNAQNLGISFAELGASVATFTLLGASAEEAITGLNGLMIALLKPSKQSEIALKALDTTMVDLKKEIREKGLALTLIRIMEAFKAMGDEGDAMMTKLIGRSQALGAFMATAGAQADTYAQNLIAIRDASELVNDGFDVISEDTGQQFLVTLQQLKNIGIEIGDFVLPAVVKLLKKIREGLKWFAGLSDESKKLATTIAGIAIAIGPALTFLGLLAVAISAISLPVVGVIVAVGALAAAFLYLADNWEAVKERISDWGWWKNAILDMAIWLIENNPIKGFTDLWNDFLLFLRQPQYQMPDWLGTLADELRELKSETKDYKHEFGTFTDAIVNGANAAKQALLGMFDAATGGGGSPITRAEGPAISLKKRGPGVDRDLFVPIQKGASEAAKGSILFFRSATEATKDWKNSLMGVDVLFTSIVSSLGLATSGTDKLRKAIEGLQKVINIIFTIARIASLFTGGGAAGSAFAGASSGHPFGMAPLFHGMASGGIVPGGFPNDSFPALLSSNEVVLPSPRSLSGVMGSRGFVAETSISMNDLIIRIKETSDKNRRMGGPTL